MKKDSIKVTAVIPAEPKTIFDAWMSSQGHTEMTGSPAKIGAKAGSAFTAWEGYISGKTLELNSPGRIVQSWRTTDFAPDDPDSRLEVLLEKARGGTKMSLVHTNIPAGQGRNYRTGWLDFYVKPMKSWFASGG
jgi:activator of HSP90 ATPase